MAPKCQLKLKIGSGLLHTMSCLVLHAGILDTSEYVKKHSIFFSEKSPPNEACVGDTQQRG